MNIGFVFTNYNNSYLSKAAVKSILATEAKEIKIVIVDNASDKNHRDILQKLEQDYENIHVIYNKHNIGYFPGLNLGIKYIRKFYPDYNYLVVGNNDLVFPQDFIHKLINNKTLFLKYPVVSPNIINLDGRPQNPHVVSYISKWREFFYDLYHLHHKLACIITILAEITRPILGRKDDYRYHTIAQEIYQGYGACYVLGPIFFEYFDKLWAPTFLMYEEFFLSKQLSDKGFKIYYEPSICLTHISRASTGKLSSKQKWLYSRQSHKEYRKYVKLFK